METHTTSDDRTTWKHWAIALTFLAFVAIGIPTIAYVLPLRIALPVAAVLAAVITGATLALGRRAR